MTLALAMTPALAVAQRLPVRFSVLLFLDGPAIWFLLPAIPAVAWLLTDARPAAALALSFTLAQLNVLAVVLESVNGGYLATLLGFQPTLIMLGITVAVMAALAWLIRHRTPRTARAEGSR
jgi:hypothetical protein